MSQTLPIFFIDSAGNETTDRIHGSPCVRASIGSLPSPQPNDTIPSIHCWALLDTGADHFYVDASILAALGAPRVRPISANAAVTYVHRAHLTITDAPFSFVDQEVAARDFIAEGQGIRAILGRRFFEYSTLTFDIGSNQNPTIIFHGARDR